jgi:flagellar basal-body rod protein FlgC
MELIKSIFASAFAMKAQGRRMEVIAQNIANADSLGQRPGEDPYQRQILSFTNVMDRELGLEVLQVGNLDKDTADFPKRFDPGHPAADEDGYVFLPNVNTLTELMDMREAQRSYEANLTMIETAKSMLMRTIDVLR